MSHQEEGGTRTGNFTSRPVPDPTILTTEQLLREIAGVNERIAALQALTDEKFRSVGEKFSLVERQRVEQKEDTTRAVEAAFSAAKEGIALQTTASERATSKSDASTKEQLAQLTATFGTAIGGVTDTLNDLKDRVGRIESVRQGASEQRTETREGISSAQAIIGIFVALLAAAGLYLGVSSREPVVITPAVPTTTE